MLSPVQALIYAFPVQSYTAQAYYRNDIWNCLEVVWSNDIQM